MTKTSFAGDVQAAIADRNAASSTDAFALIAKQL
jgi:hypothetical protein